MMSLKRSLLQLIKAYRYFLSPLLGSNCRFTPSCSQYASDAIEQHGVFKGGYLFLKRLIKCHPFHAGGYDPVPSIDKSSVSELK